ncbi:MAG: hydantoinase/oxoprolinase family protein [Deltaproteobacteria bacterium]|nr:hydantoinase/oxoprolinase family protein [Deltaproteobacteria bacterium]
MRIGIDTGGTFTDFVFLKDGEGRVHKTPSTPDNPLGAILEGLKELRPEGLDGVELVHGTTVGTNAFLTRRGARVALLATMGFEDVLFIGRQTRAELFSLAPAKPPALLPRERVVGVSERLRADGSVYLPLSADEIARIRREVWKSASESIAVCLLHAYANPSHEKLLAEALADLGAPIYLSSDILPEFREYERTSATVLNAYLAPVLSRYLDDFIRELPSASLFIQQSNGGFLPARRAASLGLATVLSGPAGGVFGAWKLGRALGEERLLTLDMGGTSTDVALIPGEIPFTSEYALEGYPLGIPVMDIHTVGAGGGSIAYRDQGGALRVGPRSAGADPGPACYGRASEVTVTDAQLYLGRLLPQSFLGGRLHLYPEAAAQALTRLAGEFDVNPRELALGVIRVVNSNMARALTAVSLEKGYDPRDFTLFCFGGAGGLHVCELAEELGVRRIIIPAQAGVLSALGMALAGLRRDLAQTLLRREPELNWEHLQPAFAALVERGLADLAEDGLPPESFSVSGELDLRYRGQSYTLSVPLSPFFKEDFHRKHRRLYGHAFPDRELEAVVLRAHFLAQEPALPLSNLRPRAKGNIPKLPTRHLVTLPGGPEEVPVYWRPSLEAGFRFAGPALILEEFATQLVLPGFSGNLTEAGHLVLSR